MNKRILNLRFGVSVLACLVVSGVGATELLHGTAKDVNALPASENRWQARQIYAHEGLNDSSYKSLSNLDFFALEYGEPFPETAFDTTDGKTFRKLFGYSQKEGGAGIRLGRGWTKYVMSRYGFDIDLEQSGDTEWSLLYHKFSGWVSEVKFSVKGQGRVKLSQTLGMGVEVADGCEISGLELVCKTPNVKGTINAFRLVPRIVPIYWRRTFTLPADPARAAFTMRNYTLFTARVNGHVVGEGNAHYGNGFRKFDLTKHVTAGLNEVTIEAETAGGYGPSVMFVGELFTVAADGSVTRFDSDGEWEYSFDGENWKHPFVGDRFGFCDSDDVGRYAASTLPLHAGALDVKPDDPNGYPVFDYDKPIRWLVNCPKGVKDPRVSAVARQTVDAQGRILEEARRPEFEGRSEDGVSAVFDKLPVGAYEITWEFTSGDRVVDTLKNEMVVCGPIGQTEASAADFENVLKPRLKLVQSVDCTKEEKDETRFLDHSGPYGQARLNVGRVVDYGNGIKARETGPNEFDFFAYKLEVGRLGAPHILEIDVPDVREQMLYCWINESYRVGFCNNGGELGSQSWPNATGSVKCGGLMPLTGEVKKLRIVFFPGTRLVTASFERGKTGGAAGVCGFRVYEVEGDLPALKVPPTERRYGNHNERQVYSAWGAYIDPAAVRYEQCGPSPRGWTAAFAAARNRTAYLRYAGHNASIEGAYMYRNAFPTRSGESETYEDEFDFRYPMLKMYKHNGIHTFIGYEYMRSPALGMKGLLDVSDRQVQAGTARTIYEVTKDGRQHVGYMGNGINFLNPEVKASMMNVLREIYERYAPAGDVEGLYVITGGWWLPGIVIGDGDGVKDVSYDDDTIELFEKETGIRLGCGWSGKERFRRRYEKLNGEELSKTWYDWRAKKMRDVLEEMRALVSSGERKWEVFSSGNRAFEPVNPFSRLGGTPAERNGYEALMRKKAGYPVELYGEGSGSPIHVLPMGEFGREVYLDDYGSLFNSGSAAIRWKSDGCYLTCGSLNEHWISCPQAKKWWWFNNGVCVYDAKQSGANAFFDCVETCAAYTPRYIFHTWTDVNVTSAHADECRRFLEGFYATPLDRNPKDVPEVKGVIAKRYGDAVQLVNATPWSVEGEGMVIPPYGIVVKKVGIEGEFKMAEGCPYPDFAAARKAYDYETMRKAACRESTERGRPNQERFLAMLAQDGVARIDAGKATDTVDEKGYLWLPDQPYGGGDTYGNEFARYVDRGPVAIEGTERPSIYRTESGAGVDRIVYHFPVPKGTYRLVCHIAETWDKIPGHLLEVEVNGEKRRVDVWQTCGGRMRAGKFVFKDIKVEEGGEIVYDSLSHSIINAFEIYRTDVLPSGAIHMRDPYVITDTKKGVYCLLSSYFHPDDETWISGGWGFQGRGAQIYESKDLVHWSPPYNILEIPPEVHCGMLWAPEIHQYKGKWYLFGTVTTGRKLASGADERGTWSFVADDLRGPYRPTGKRSLTPPDRQSLDGTLFVEDDIPYLVYCDEWCQPGTDGMGTVRAVRLNDELSAPVGEAMTLFKATDYKANAFPNAPEDHVTDGPFFYRSPKSGKLFMIWSNIGPNFTYVLVLSESESGRLAGPWKKHRLLFEKDGGHGMIFRKLDGSLALALHQPNNPPKERPRFFDLVDDGETLVCDIGAKYVVKRDGMETARTALKRDDCGIQWMKVTRVLNDRWNPVHPCTPYDKQITDELIASWGGSPSCHPSRYPASLWWAQYQPGGRETSSHTVFFDSSIMVDSMAADPDLAERQFETIIRQCYRFAPYQSRAVVHADIAPFVEAYKAGKEPEAITRAEALAAHYRLPSLNLAKAAAEGGETAVKEAISAFVKIVLGREGEVRETYTDVKPPAPKNAGINDQCHLFTYEDGSVRKLGDWKIGVKSPSVVYMSGMAPSKAGDCVEIEFRGTEIGLVDFTSQDGAVYAYRIDKGEWKTLPAEAAASGQKYRERHTPFAQGLFYNGKVSAKDDSDRHTMEMKVVKPGEGVIVGFLINGSTADEDSGAGGSPETLADIDRVWKDMDPIKYVPPEDRHGNLTKTMKRLRDGDKLNIVALGDSIIADTCRSKFWLLMERYYPKCKVSCACSVRSATGCWWYKDDNRVESWVFSHKPDLVVIGGVSQRDDIDAIRSVIRQIRAKDPEMEILLLTPVFGIEGQSKDAGWNVGWDYNPEKAEHPFRRDMKRLAEEEKCAFFDINAPWRQYILDSGKDMGYFHRDLVHANTRGEQLVGHLLERWFETSK